MSRTRHPLKAYLSDIQPDRTERHTRSYVEYTAEAALLEVRELLAVTEPDQPDYRHMGPGHWSLLEIGFRYPNSSPCSDDGAALADTLACILGAPDFAEELRLNQIEDGTKAGALAYCAAVKARGDRQ